MFRASSAGRLPAALARQGHLPADPQQAAAVARSPAPDYSSFAIGFDERDRARLHQLWDGVIDSGRWSEGDLTRRFEEAWAAWNGLPSVALGSWTGGALTALEYAGVRGQTVLCPSNTFMATPLAAVYAGARVEFVACGSSPARCSPPGTPARAGTSSTASARTSACRTRTSSARSPSTSHAPSSWCTSAATSL